MNNSGTPYYNTNSQSLTNVSLNNSSNLNFPIRWEDNNNLDTDVIRIVVNVTYFLKDGNSTPNNANGYYPKDYTVNINRVLAPNISSPLIKACSTANVTICASDYGTANSFAWTINNATIVSGQGSSCITVTPFLTGNLYATCEAKRTTGLPTYKKFNSKTLYRSAFTGSAVINGASTFCTSSSYSLANLLPNQTVTWSLSNPAFATLSASTGTATTITGVYQGDVTLKAKITNACGESYEVTKNLTIGINGIVAKLNTPSGLPYAYPYNNVPESCTEPVYLFTTSSENTNLNSTTKKMRFTCNGVSIIKNPVGNYYFYLYASDFNINQGNSFDVKVEVGNECGFPPKSLIFRLYRPTLCQCGVGTGCSQLPRIANNIERETESKETIKVYPNPANDFITIALKEENTKAIIDAKIVAKLYDIVGHLVLETEIKSNNTTVNTSGFAKGIYVLNINKNGEEENHQIIVE
jgi:hypothetical protein